jgi:hypothetical protein
VTITPDGLKAAVKQAVDDLRITFPSYPMRLVPDEQGGVWVEMTGAPLGPPYAVDDTFLVFLLPFTLPASDIYPMFVRADLARLDGSQLGDGFQVTKLAWPGESSARPVVQVSRRTRGSLTAQTASQKVSKVLAWVRTR